MYYTHGDMVIFRSDGSERYAASSRSQRPRKSWPDAGQSDRIAPWQPPTEGVWNRVADLEARVSRLESQLDRVAQRERSVERSERHPDRRRESEPGWQGDRELERFEDGPNLRAERPARTPSRGSGGKRYPVNDRQVKVSLHAEGGAQVSLGEVRMLHQN